MGAGWREAAVRRRSGRQEVLTGGPSASGALVCVDGGHEGLFHGNQLVRTEGSQAAVQRALGAAAKARALAM